MFFLLFGSEECEALLSFLEGAHVRCRALSFGERSTEVIVVKGGVCLVYNGFEGPRSLPAVWISDSSGGSWRDAAEGDWDVFAGGGVNEVGFTGAVMGGFPSWEGVAVGLLVSQVVGGRGREFGERGGKFIGIGGAIAAETHAGADAGDAAGVELAGEEFAEGNNGITFHKGDRRGNP